MVKQRIQWSTDYIFELEYDDSYVNVLLLLILKHQHPHQDTHQHPHQHPHPGCGSTVRDRIFVVRTLVYMIRISVMVVLYIHNEDGTECERTMDSG